MISVYFCVTALWGLFNMVPGRIPKVLIFCPQLIFAVLLCRCNGRSLI